MSIWKYLTQPDEEVKDMGVVVDHRAGGDIGGKLRLTLSVQRLIEVIFPLIEPVLPQSDGPAVQAPNVSLLSRSQSMDESFTRNE